MGLKVRVESFLPAVAAAQADSPLSKVCFISSLVGTSLSTLNIVPNLFIWHGRLSCPVKAGVVICTTVPSFTLCDTIRGGTLRLLLHGSVVSVSDGRGMRVARLGLIGKTSGARSWVSLAIEKRVVHTIGHQAGVTFLASVL